MSIYFQGLEQSLEDILKSREERSRHQRNLIEGFGKTLLSFKLNIPGPVKNNSLIKSVFHEGIKEIKSSIEKLKVNIILEETVYKNSGPEFYAVADMKADELKFSAVRIEENHPLGRVFDFDIWDNTGKQLSRSDLGFQGRRCFLCEEEAFNCARSRKHSIEEMISSIESRALKYFGENSNKQALLPLTKE
ncbi:citrate lyase holo-[acyl-carrier protein] synthase [Clostridium polynesiense]|uniref:citrate lyase holo-[acyl-carrier protein] synthase n=1 Tax=Clostridium polynesiense TaxID=1325933 RepID=UPI0006936EA8|nr:citrate lyase holo-[acyl-carrier protein] synthase [Clostridium polynesiense]